MCDKQLHYNANDEFTWKKFRETLQYANKIGYISMTCNEYFLRKHQTKLDDKTIIFRADVDRSPKKALEMAKIMAELDIKATYFFRLHSQYYNLLSFNNLYILKRIRSIGFEVGLHSEPIDGAYVLNEEPSVIMRKDIAVLNVLLNERIARSASHRDNSGLNNLEFWKTHRPEDFGLNYKVYDEKSLGLFQRSVFISESQLDRWKVYKNGSLVKGDYRTLREHLENKHALVYVLVHPFLFRKRHYFEEL